MQLFRGVIGRVAITLAFVATACLGETPTAQELREVALSPTASHPHDAQAFTQGLVFHDSALWESTGLRGESSLRRVELSTGQVTSVVPLDAAYFGEGLAIAPVNGRQTFFQLTWQAGQALAYEWNGSMFSPTAGGFRYEGEGWGLAVLDGRLVLSDGTSSLRFLDMPRDGTAAQAGTVTVTDNGQPVERLNELEVVDGWVLANVWYDSRIAVIEPGTGNVRAWLSVDIPGWLGFAPGQEEVLNGIAYDPQRQVLFITGKRWPRLFEVDWAATRALLGL